MNAQQNQAILKSGQSFSPHRNGLETAPSAILKTRVFESMPAYLIADVNIHDAALYEEYKKLTPSTVAAYDGKFIARGGNVDTLEGEWVAQRIVIVEFPSRDQAKRWLESPEYSTAREMRHRAASSRILVVEGI